MHKKRIPVALDHYYSWKNSKMAQDVSRVKRALPKLAQKMIHQLKSQVFRIGINS